jgi:Kef-type K+ transport system membrane component KefB
VSHSPLLLQLVVILGTARILGWLLRFLGQPPVIGEMMAGVVLGPIVLGQFAPDFHAELFASASLGALDGLSQLGLVLFMFIVGAELRLPIGARKQFMTASWIGTLSVLVPMIAGLGVGVYSYAEFAHSQIGLWPYALFLAAAMSITAFPVMARILKDRRMTDSPIGSLSLASAAVADVLAWVLLALVVMLIGARQDWLSFLKVVFGTAVLIAIALAVVRPALSMALRRYAKDGRPDGGLLAGLLMGAFGCAYLTNLLGVHAVFGAFLFGACLPRDDRLLAALIERIEHIAILVLMPIFFALAGLSTTPDVFVGTSLMALFLILGTAIAGKIAGSALGARIAGQSWRSAFAIGSLMNARGMMELVVIKVGLDIGVIDGRMFTMLMIMAIVTTCMTGPLLSLFERAATSARAKVQTD